MSSNFSDQLQPRHVWKRRTTVLFWQWEKSGWTLFIHLANHFCSRRFGLLRSRTWKSTYGKGCMCPSPKLSRAFLSILSASMIAVWCPQTSFRNLSSCDVIRIERRSAAQFTTCSYASSLPNKWERLKPSLKDINEFVTPQCFFAKNLKGKKGTVYKLLVKTSRHKTYTREVQIEYRNRL